MLAFGCVHLFPSTTADLRAFTFFIASAIAASFSLRIFLARSIAMSDTQYLGFGLVTIRGTPVLLSTTLTSFSTSRKSKTWVIGMYGISEEVFIRSEH